MLTNLNNSVQLCADRVIPEKAVHLEPPCCTIKSRNTTRGIKMKTCLSCPQIKPLSEFYKNRNTKDGLRYWCKTCEKAHQKAYQQTKRGKAVHRKRVAKYQKTPNGKAFRRKANAKYNALHPNNIKAINAVNHAIRAGRLPQPNTRFCHYCGAKAEQYHHYLGYELEHWFDVLPVCVECHRKEHKAQTDSCPCSL